MIPPHGQQRVWSDLASARPLSDAEVGLVAPRWWMLPRNLYSGPNVDDVVIQAVCRCGCSSLRLRTDGPAIPTQRVAALSSTGRSDYFAVHAVGTGARQHVTVVLHVVNGRLHDLEVFDSLGGEGVAVPVDERAVLTEARLE